MKKSAKLVILVASLALVGGAGAWWWSSASRTAALRSRAVSLLPQRPQGLKPAEFQHRVEAAEELVREGKDWLDGVSSLATMYHANGYTQQALDLYGVLMSADPSSARWPDRIAGIYALYGQLDRAMVHWGKAADREPGYLPAKLHLADALVKSNRPKEAQPIYEDVLKRDPGNAYAVAGLAKVEIAAGNLIAAKTRLEAAGVQSQVKIGENILVTVYEKLGETDKAEQIRGRAKSTDSYIEVPDPYVDEVAEEGYDVFRLALDAGGARRAGDADRGMRLIQRAIRVAPNYAISYHQLGQMYMNDGNPEGAKKAFRDAIERDPSYGDSWRLLIEVLERQGSKGEADAVLEEGLRRCPDSPSLHLMQGKRLKEADRLDEALEEFEKVTRLRPTEIAGLVESALIHFSREQNDQAIALLNRALEIIPDHPLVISTLAIYYISIKDKASARKWIRRCETQPRLRNEGLSRVYEAYESQFGHRP